MVARRTGAWCLIGILCLLTAVIWFGDTRVVLGSTHPEVAWFAAAVMWVEIIAVSASLVLRYRRLTGLGPTIAAASGSLSVNLVGALVLWPAIALI
jgi:hypothetical protein